MDFGIASVAAITVIVYVIGAIVKSTPLANKWIPAIAGVCGIALGIVAFFVGVPDFPANDIITAAAVGAVSGLAATGVNQIGKQLTEKDD